jgi:hypothetical protein
MQVIGINRLVPNYILMGWRRAKDPGLQGRCLDDLIGFLGMQRWRRAKDPGLQGRGGSHPEEYVSTLIEAASHEIVKLFFIIL